MSENLDKSITDKQKNFLSKAFDSIKNFLTANKQIQDKLKNEIQSAANEEKFLLGKTSGWWVIFIFRCMAVVILVLLAYQGLNSWYYYQWATVLERSKHVFTINNYYLDYIIHWLLSKDSLDLPINELVNGMTYCNLLYSGVEVGLGVIKAKDAEIGTMKELPFKQRYRMFQMLFTWFIMVIIATALKASLGTRGFEYYLGEMYFGFSTSFCAFVSAERIIKLANQRKGKVDKEKEIIEDAQFDKMMKDAEEASAISKDSNTTNVNESNN